MRYEDERVAKRLVRELVVTREGNRRTVVLRDKYAKHSMGHQAGDSRNQHSLHRLGPHQLHEAVKINIVQSTAGCDVESVRVSLRGFSLRGTSKGGVLVTRREWEGKQMKVGPTPLWQKRV